LKRCVANSIRCLVDSNTNTFSCRNEKESSAGSIATFNVDHKSSKELRQYLANIAEQCEHSASELPTIIVLDNLHHVSSLAEVFNGFLSIKHVHWSVYASSLMT